jgi:hypothetical protein
MIPDRQPRSVLDPQALARLATASLRESRVSGVARGSLRELCPRLREVDLRGNLLARWGDGGVAELGRELPQPSLWTRVQVAPPSFAQLCR